MRAQTSFNKHVHKPPPTGYQWLLFDADGTLFDYDAGEKAALSRSFARIGVPFAPHLVPAYREINQSLWRALEKGQITPELLKVRRFELLLNQLGIEHSPSAFSQDYLENLAACAELMPDAEVVVAGLHAHYQLAVVTNGLSMVQRGRLARAPIGPHIDHIIISEEVGSAKPEAAFFEEVFTRIGSPPKKAVLMIGDSWSADIQGAAEFGLDTCWFNPARKPRPGTLAITREIAALRELLGWLT